MAWLTTAAAGAGIGFGFLESCGKGIDMFTAIKKDQGSNMQPDTIHLAVFMQKQRLARNFSTS
jgi:hypothetical protein